MIYAFQKYSKKRKFLFEWSLYHAASPNFSCISEFQSGLTYIIRKKESLSDSQKPLHDYFSFKRWAFFGLCWVKPFNLAYFKFPPHFRMFFIFANPPFFFCLRSSVVSYYNWPPGIMHLCIYALVSSSPTLILSCSVTYRTLCFDLKNKEQDSSDAGWISVPRP